MKKITLLFVLLSVNIFAQAPAIEWQKCLGGFNTETAGEIDKTPDGGYIIAGTSNSTNGSVTGNHGGYDYWVVKLDATGNILWQKSLGGSGIDNAYSIKSTSDGGCVVAGLSFSTDGNVTGNHGDFDYWVVKLDATGNIQWQKSIGGPGVDVAYDIQNTSDGGYVVAGLSRSNGGNVTGNHGNDDYWIVKLDATGNIQWQKSLGGSSWDGAYAIQTTSDGGYIVAGNSQSNDGNVTGNHGGDDYWVVKLDNSGNIQWQKSLGGSASDVVSSIQQTSDGGYIVAGNSNSTNGDISTNLGGYDYWVVKLNEIGNILWQKSFGGTYEDTLNSINTTADGGFIMAGNTYSNDGNVTGNQGMWDYWAVKINSTGNIQWQKTLGGSGDDIAASVLTASDGGYVVAGHSNSTDGNITFNYGNFDYWVVKLSPDILSTPIYEKQTTVIYPNPTKGIFTINANETSEAKNIFIYTVLGQKIYNSTFISNESIIDISGQPKGVYFYEVLFENNVVKIGKLVVE